YPFGLQRSEASEPPRVLRSEVDLELGAHLMGGGAGAHLRQPRVVRLELQVLALQVPAETAGDLVPRADVTGRGVERADATGAGDQLHLGEEEPAGLQVGAPSVVGELAQGP